jgi:RNA recognition motif-containing protein
MTWKENCRSDTQKRRFHMGKKLYVGNLSYDVNNEALEGLFSNYGTVESATVIMDRTSGRSKGFGFVEMSTDEEAQAAMAALDGQDSGGRPLKVNEAKPRENRGGGGRQGGFGGGGRRRY